MELVCKVYWEMCRDVRVKIPDEKLPPLDSQRNELAAELAQEQVDVYAPGAEFVLDSINCDPTSDVQPLPIIPDDHFS